MDSNSIGGILIPRLSPYNIPMGKRPRTKALKEEQLKGELKGDLAAYEEFGLFQRSVNQNTAYRYRGVLLRYQQFLGQNPPSLAASVEYLSSLRKNDFDPSTLRLYRAALAGFHQWRGEELKFKVKVPETSARFVPWDIVQQMLELASTQPHDELILRLMTDAGLRRKEVVNLNVNNVESNRLRFRGKGGKERTVPMTDELQKLVIQFSDGKPRDASLAELGEKGIYMMVKRYGALAGMPEISPHDLRRAFGTHLLNVTRNIRVVQEILGHSNVNTTQVYTAVTFNNLEEAIKKLNMAVDDKNTKSLQTEDAKASVAEHRNHQEALHKWKIRKLARDLSEKINPPSPWDKDLWKHFPIDFRPGQYYLLAGEVDIEKDGQIKVKYHHITASIAEPHIVKGFYSHLNTSGLARFMELAGDQGKFVKLFTEIEQYSQALLTLLKLITDEISKNRVRLRTRDEIKPGLTKWFVLTAWNDILQRAGNRSWIRDSWYQPPESIPDCNLYQLKCGAYIIGIADSKKALKRYEDWHKRLRVSLIDHPIIKRIISKELIIDILVQEIRERLQEFSDMETLPGSCDLC